MAEVDVLVCGSLHYDIVVDAPRLPMVDETLAGKSWQPVFGGKGRNQAVAAARLGARTALIGRIGDDGFGHAIKEDLVRSGVDSHFVTVAPGRETGMSVAIVDPNGEYGAVIVSAANQALAPDTVTRAVADIGQVAVAVIQNEIPTDANLALLKACRETDTRTIWNAAPTRKSANDLLSLVDVLVVNRLEAAMMTGSTIETEADIQSTARALAGGDRSIVVTLGADGVLLFDEADAVRLPGHKVDVASTHGAGDAFVGALAARLSRGAKIADAATYANRVAAKIVATPPADRSTLTIEDFA